MSSISLSAALRGTLLSLRETQRGFEETSLRLSTGKEVNRAIDEPQNFFTSEALKSRASDFARVRNNLQQGILTVQEGLIGVDALATLMDQAKAVANESRALAAAGLPDPNIFTRGDPVGDTLSTEILNDNPIAYWRLNETAGATATNIGTGGSLNGTYVNAPVLGQPALYTNGGDVTPNFNGVDQNVNIPNSGLINVGARAERTVELVFNAVTTAGRQVLYEEGGTTNSFTIYIDNGNLYVEGRDAGAWGPLGINAPVNAGQTYHVALVFDQPNNSFTGYLDGAPIGAGGVANQNFPSHTGSISIGSLRGGAWFHDGPQGGNGNFFNGQISDVAIYNTALADAEILQHAESLTATGLQYFNSEFEKLMNEIDRITMDARYAGINLLAGDDLITTLNEDGSHTLTTEGVNFTSQGLNIKSNDFLTEGEIRSIMDSVEQAIQEIQLYGNNLSTDLSILNNRITLSDKTINSHRGGAEDITLANLSQEGANLLALEIRQNLGSRALTLAAEGQQTVLRIFVSGDTSGVFS